MVLSERNRPVTVLVLTLLTTRETRSRFSVGEEGLPTIRMLFIQISASNLQQKDTAQQKPAVSYLQVAKITKIISALSALVPHLTKRLYPSVRSGQYWSETQEIVLDSFPAIDKSKQETIQQIRRTLTGL